MPVEDKAVDFICLAIYRFKKPWTVRSEVLMGYKFKIEVVYDFAIVPLFFSHSALSLVIKEQWTLITIRLFCLFILLVTPIYPILLLFFLYIFKDRFHKSNGTRDKTLIDLTYFLFLGILTVPVTSLPRVH